MNDNIQNINENFGDVNNNLEYELHLQKIRKELSERFIEYQKTMKYLASDAPIQILCLPKNIEKFLLDNGCLRIYDVFNLDLTKIEGISESSLRDITSRFDQFFSML